MVFRGRHALGRTKPGSRRGVVWAFALALANLLFALAPHHHQIRHTHEDDGHGHRHAVSTLHQAKLEREVLAALESSAQGASAHFIEKLTSTGGQEPEGLHEAQEPGIALGTGDSGLKSKTHSSHDHFFTDPNVESDADDRIQTWELCGHVLDLPQKSTQPAKGFVALALARGPPRA